VVKEVNNMKQLDAFVYFVRDLYKDCKHYVYPVFYILKRELKKLILKDKTYKALLFLEGDIVLGRLLYVFAYNDKLDIEVCYFSYLDCYDNQAVFNALFSYMEEDMKSLNVTYSEGTYAPYDPDNRRGVLIKGFEDDPVIFTSYNYSYYQSLFENYGYIKAHDTFSLELKKTDENVKKLNTLAKFFDRRFNIEVSPINLQDIDNEILDVHKILESATTEEIYQSAPSIEVIKAVAKNLKFFLEPKIILIAREKESKEPIGFVFCLLDYNQIFKKTKGRIKLLKLLRPLRHINRSRGLMQYVVPKYQNSGLIGYLYKKVYDSFEELGITAFEAGTMMENNLKPFKAMEKFGAEISKIYRIYGKEI